MTADALAGIDWRSFELTPIREADIDELNRWQNTPEIRDLTMAFRGPVPLSTTGDWLRTLQTETVRTRVLFAIRAGGDMAGLAQLHAINWVQRTAALGIYVGDAARRGAGLGHGATVLILDYAFNGLDLERVGLEVLASNTAAKRLYRTVGFTHEGTLRSAYNLAGRRQDVEIHGLLRSEWATTPPSEARRLVFAAGGRGDQAASAAL